MTDRTMRGLLRSAAVACAPLLALASSLAPSLAPSRVQAQATQAIDNNLIVKRNGRVVDNSTIVYTDVADCGGEEGTEDDADFEFSVSYNSNVPVVEAWLGVGNVNCATPSNRLKNSATALPSNCTRLGQDVNSPRTPVISVPGKQLFSKDGTGNVCDAVFGSPTYTVYILPLPMASTDTLAPEVLMIGTISTLRATFTPYTRRPKAPTNLRGQRGESRLGVNFDAPTNSVPLTRYKAYFDIGGGSGGGGTDSGTADAGAADAGGADAGAADAGAADAGASDTGNDADVADAGGGDASSDDAGPPDAGTPDAGTPDAGATDAGSTDAGSGDAGSDAGSDDDGSSAPLTCGSGRLEGNQQAPVNQSGIRVSARSNTESASLSDLNDVPLGTSVAVAVVTIDPAGNESLLSTPICIDRVPTEGYLDACTLNNDCDLESCSARPGASGSALGLSFFALALAALIRRRGRA